MSKICLQRGYEKYLDNPEIHKILNYTWNESDPYSATANLVYAWGEVSIIIYYPLDFPFKGPKIYNVSDDTIFFFIDWSVPIAAPDKFLLIYYTELYKMMTE